MPTKTSRLLTLTAAVLFCFTFPVQAADTGLVLEAKTMNRSADPCTDFFEYANGKWLAANPVPADRARYSSYDEISERNLAALKHIVAEATAAGAKASAPARMVGAYYQSGIDEARIEADGAKPLADSLARIDAITTRDALLTMVASLHQFGAIPVFNFYIDQDAKNTQRYIPQLAQGGLGLPDRDYYLKSDAKTRKMRKQYVEHMTRMFGLLGDAPAVAKQNAAIVMAMETRLARASMSKVQLRDPLSIYHLMSVPALSKSTHTDWSVYFNGIGLAAPGDINVAQPKFFTEAAHQLQTAPLTQWKTYLRWHLVNAAAPSLSSAFVNADFEFFGRTMAGTKELQPRWKRVLIAIDHSIGEALGELYVEKFFTPAAKTGALDMVGNIKLAMRESINSLEWMTPATKTQALRKLNTLVVKIGYPDTWRDYSALRIEPVSYAGNVLRANQFEFKRNLNKLGKPIDRSEWGMTPTTVNAYYNPTMNEMVFPAGILQPPLFHVDADAASNYGNTGATIGHELTHAFDDEGRQFDADGNLKSWWTKDDEKNFIARASGIEKQFDEYTPIDKIHINGKLTAGENIADLGGLKIALQALKKSLAGKPQPAPIDGLTVEQRFFVAYGQSFRTTMRPEQLRLQLATDPHAPDKYRVLAPLANMPEFADAFACSPDKSPLRQKDKRVIIW